MLQQATGGSAAKALILVVHATAGHARPVERLLEGAGYEVVSASESDEILTLVNYGKPDLLVVTGGGASFLAKQMARRAVSPIIIVVVDEGNVPGADEDEPLRCPLDALLDKVSECLALPA